MARTPSFCGVMLAAGESSRRGRDKALLPWPRQETNSAAADTFLSAAIRLFFSHVDVVLVVVGKNENALAPVIYANGASLVVNPAPHRGQFSSLQVGLHEVLNRGRDAAIITLVDRPPVSTATVILLREAYESAPQNIWTVVPQFSGKHGHPYIAGRELIEVFLQAAPTGNARDLEHRYQQHIQYVAVSDPFVALNIDTPEDYAALLAKSS